MAQYAKHNKKIYIFFSFKLGLYSQSGRYVKGASPHPPIPWR